jgi:hypothetical protein
VSELEHAREREGVRGGMQKGPGYKDSSRVSH